MRIGNYTVSSDSETFRIFPRNKKGESIPVTITRTFLHLRHAAGALVTITRYRHRRDWLWRDSRYDKPVTYRQVVDNVASMLFKGNKATAADLLQAAVDGCLVTWSQRLAA